MSSSHDCFLLWLPGKKKKTKLFQSMGGLGTDQQWPANGEKVGNMTEEFLVDEFLFLSFVKDHVPWRSLGQMCCG